jgi:hypothetical protein
MEPIGIFEILIILAILFFCVVVPIAVFFIIRFVIKKGKRIAQTAPDQIQRTVMRGLEKLDERLPNDPREADRWSSGNDELDLDAVPVRSRVEPDEKLPDQRGSEVSHCSACGAPLKGGRKTCDYCGHTS